MPERGRQEKGTPRKERGYVIVRQGYTVLNVPLSEQEILMLLRLEECCAAFPPFPLAPSAFRLEARFFLLAPPGSQPLTP